MVDIQCPTAEIRRGNKKDRKKKPQDENICLHPAMQGGHKNIGANVNERDVPNVESVIGVPSYVIRWRCVIISALKTVEAVLDGVSRAR